MIVRHSIAAVSALVVACHAPPSTIPVPAPAPAARACPAPDLSIDWTFVPDSSAITLALPPGFEEHSSGLSSRHWQLAGDFQQYMGFGIVSGPLPMASYRRVYQPELMLDYSECEDSVAGQRVSIQAWRTPNGTFRDSRRLDRYDVFAIWEVRPGTFAWLMGGTYVRSTQAVILGAVRAWRRRTP